MRKLFFLFILQVVAISVFAQEWVTDIDKAKAVAKEQNKKIVLVFQGSDWCAPCMKLDREIWSTDVFKKHAENSYVMLQADFPRKKANKLSKDQQEKNNALAEKYNQNGYFPHVVVLNAEGIVLGKTGYKKMSPQAYIKHLDSL